MSEIKTVNIQIMGTSYPIQCKSEKEVETLKKSADYINDIVKDIKQAAPSLPREKLMVLASITLCERLFEEQESEKIDRESFMLIQSMLESTSNLIKPASLQN